MSDREIVLQKGSKGLWYDISDASIYHCFLKEAHIPSKIRVVAKVIEVPGLEDGERRLEILCILDEFVITFQRCICVPNEGGGIWITERDYFHMADMFKKFFEKSAI